MNWTQEPDPRRLALLDRLVRANQTLWDRFTTPSRRGSRRCMTRWTAAAARIASWPTSPSKKADADGQLVTWLEHVTDEEYGRR
jgi:hypothetical protein